MPKKSGNLYQISTHKTSGENEIVFLHGYQGSVRSGKRFAKILSKEAALNEWGVRSFEYKTGLSVNSYGFWKGNPNLITLANQLWTTIENELKKAKSIAIIAHSTGGLVAQRAILDFPELREKLSHLFLVSVPTNGLVKATVGRGFLSWLGLRDDQITDLGYDSKFIADLRKRLPAIVNNPNFVLRVIAGDVDQFVPPESSMPLFKEEFIRVIPGNHLETIRPKGRENLVVKLVVNTMVGDDSFKGIWSPAQIANQQGDFKRAILELEPNKDELDGDGLVELALAYEGVGRAEDAFKLLSNYAGKHLDVLGTAAGRFKRKWLQTRRKADAQRALELYQKGFNYTVKIDDHDQAYYHGINLAFMTLMMAPNSAAARKKVAEIASEVLDHCSKAIESKWRAATEAEANVYLQKMDEAMKSYREFVEDYKPAHRDLYSTYQQAIKVIETIFQKPAERDAILVKLNSIFKPE